MTVPTAGLWLSDRVQCRGSSFRCGGQWTEICCGARGLNQLLRWQHVTYGTGPPHEKQVQSERGQGEELWSVFKGDGADAIAVSSGREGRLLSLGCLSRSMAHSFLMGLRMPWR